MSAHTVARQNGLNLLARVANVRHSLREIAVRKAIYDRATRELHAYSDSELGELGLARCDIPRVAKATVAAEMSRR